MKKSLLTIILPALILFSCAGTSNRDSDGRVTLNLGSTDIVLRDSLTRFLEDFDLRNDPVFGQYYTKTSINLPENLSSIITVSETDFKVPAPYTALHIKVNVCGTDRTLPLDYDLDPNLLVKTSVEGFHVDDALRGANPKVQEMLRYSLFGFSPERYISRIECFIENESCFLELLPASPLPRIVVVDNLPDMRQTGVYLEIKTIESVDTTDRETMYGALCEQLLSFGLSPVKNQDVTAYTLEVTMQPVMIQDLSFIGPTNMKSRRVSIRCALYYNERMIENLSFSRPGLHIAEREARNKAITATATDAITTLVQNLANKTWIIKEQ